MKLFLSIVMLTTLMSCSTSPPLKLDRGAPERVFTVLVKNVSDHAQSIGVRSYDDKNEIIGVLDKELYNSSSKHSIAVGETYSHITSATGVVITYNYKSEDRAFGRRARWRPGVNREITIEYEFRNKAEGVLVQTKEY